MTQDRERRKLPISTRYYSAEISTLHADTHLLAATDGDFSPESTKTDLTFFFDKCQTTGVGGQVVQGVDKNYVSIVFQCF